MWLHISISVICQSPSLFVITNAYNISSRHLAPLFDVHINSFYTDFPCLLAVVSQTRAKSGPTAARVVRRRFDKARLTVDRDGAA